MANPQYLFNRDWTVSIIEAGQTETTYKDIRVVFDIEKNNLSTSNKAKISVYNLDLSSRKRFVQGNLIKLQAGYVNLSETIFYGNIAKATTKRDGPDIITEFECGDGEQQIIYTLFNKSYPPGTTYVQVIRDIATILQSVGIGIGTVLSMPQQVFNLGRTFSGTVKAALDNLTKNIGYQWSIQNGQLQIVPVKHDNGEEIIVITETTGMIGVPSQGTDFIQFTSLLNPKIVPDCKVGILSQAIQGDFKVNKAKYEGDTHGDKWQVSCECVRIGTTQAFTPNRGLDFFTTVA